MPNWRVMCPRSHVNSSRERDRDCHVEGLVGGRIYWGESEGDLERGR